MMADHYKNGDIPKQAITYQEEQSRAAFEAGKLLFHAQLAVRLQPGQH